MNELQIFFRGHEYKQCDFTVFGDVVGKGRPRFSTRNGFPQAYTPKKTADYEKQIKSAYLEKYKPMMFESGAIFLEVDVTIGVPKSESKKKKEHLIEFEEPTKKPDIDNILKIVMDALNGIAYTDDSQITHVVIHKRYGWESLITIRMWEEKR